MRRCQRRFRGGAKSLGRRSAAVPVKYQRVAGVADARARTASAMMSSSSNDSIDNAHDTCVNYRR